MISDRFAPVLRELQPLSDRFAAAGHRLFLVGGTVRDVLLSGSAVGPEFDIDATTTARPDEIKRCLQGWADAVWTQGERFGTIGAMKRVPSDLPGAAPGDTIERIYEVTTHRAEAYRDSSRKPDVEFSLDIHADLSRRDFTVNAMAIEVTPTPGTGTANAAGGTSDEPVLIDPFGGAHDLAARVLRTPAGPEASFSDDPLRMLRAARFIARYRLQPEPTLLRAVRSMADRMQIVSAERIRDELDKLLAAPRPAEGLRFVAETGLLQYVVPELAAAASQADAACHPHMWAHVVALVDAQGAPDVDGDPFDSNVVSGRRDLRLERWAALLHPLGSHGAGERMRALRHANDDTRDVMLVIELFAPLLDRLAASSTPWSDGDVRRFLREAGTMAVPLQSLVRADLAVRAGSSSSPSDTRAGAMSDAWHGLDQHIRQLAEREPLDDWSPELDGAAVMAVLGVGPGRAVGEALDQLVALRLDEGVVGQDAARHHLEEWWRHHQEE